MSNKDLKKLQGYRIAITALDAEIFRLLRQRIKMSQKIMKFKTQKKISVIDTKREAEIERQIIKTLETQTTKARAKKFVQSLLQLNVKYPKK